MKIAEIFVYPIKSLRGTAVDEALVCGYGIQHDRQWMLVDADSRMITQRECPRLATLHPHVEDNRLRIELPGRGAVDVSFDSDASTARQVTVDVWGHGSLESSLLMQLTQLLAKRSASSAAWHRSAATSFA